MAENKKIEPQKGILTTSMEVNTKEFTAFQLLLSNKADSLSKKQKLRIELLALQIRIEDYLSSKNF